MLSVHGGSCHLMAKGLLIPARQDISEVQMKVALQSIMYHI